LIFWVPVRKTLPIPNPTGLQVQVSFVSVQAAGPGTVPTVAEEVRPGIPAGRDAQAANDTIRSASKGASRVPLIGLSPSRFREQQAM
jgi:hypothetical protein